MAKQIVIDDREYIEIVDKNGTVTGGFMFNPADLDIIKSADTVQKKFEELELPADDDPDGLDKMSGTVKELFDELLNTQGASDDLFKHCNPWTPYKDGRFFCEYVLDQLVKFIESEMNVRIKKSTSRLRNYHSLRCFLPYSLSRCSFAAFKSYR